MARSPSLRIFLPFSAHVDLPLEALRLHMGGVYIHLADLLAEIKRKWEGEAEELNFHAGRIFGR